MLLVRCPKCHHDMKYLPGKGDITEKIKRCVYCGHSFKVYSNQNKSRIVKIIDK